MAFNSNIFGSKPAGSAGITPAAPLFGSSTSAPAKPLFGGGTGIFGQPQQQTTTQPSTGLFAQQQQQPNTTGSFGQPAGAANVIGTFGQAQQQPASTGLFGQPQQQQPQQSASTPLFGQSTAQPSTGPFGQPTPQQPQQGTGMSLFGQPLQQQQQQAAPSLFGNNPLMSQPTNPVLGGGGGLGASTLGGSIFGQQSRPQPHPTAPTPNQTLLSKSTKFNDLQEPVKKILENIDTHIQGRIQISKDLHQRKLGGEALKGRELLRGVHKELVQTASTIHADALLTRDLKGKADQAVQDTIIATRIVDGFHSPQQHGAYIKNHANFPLEFFTRITDQMRERLRWYKTMIDQIERKLSSSANHTQYTPQAISTTLQSQHATFIALASKTAAVDTELQKLKAFYTQLWRAKTGSIRDPFDGLGWSVGDDFGLGNMNV